jgi:hypothetical protein
MWVQQPLVPHEGVVLVGIHSIFMCRIFLATIYPSDKIKRESYRSQTLENNFEKKKKKMIKAANTPLIFVFNHIHIVLH